MAVDLNCSANEVQLVSATAEVQNSCTDAPFGQATVRITFNLEANASRYDLSLYVPRNGLDPRQGTGSTNCLHEILRPISGTPNPRNPSGAGPFRNLDADFCGDIQSETSPPTTDAIFKSSAVTVDCVDNDDDGFVDVLPGVTWNQNSGPVCGSVSDAIFGAGSKCSVSMAPFDIGGLTQPARISVTKTTVSATLFGQSGGNYTYDVIFRVRVQNTGLQDLTSVNVFDDLNSTFSGAGSWSLTSAQLLAAQSNFSEGGSMAVNPGYTGIPPNHNLVNTAVSRRLNYDDTLPVSDQGDYATFEIAARYTTTCPANRVNVVTVNGTPLLSGSQVSANANSNVGCTPTAVGAFELRADSGLDPWQRRLLGGAIVSLLLAMAWVLRSDRPRSFVPPSR